MPDNEVQQVPPWVAFVLEQMDKRFDGINARLDTLVSRDSFRQEQSRVNDKFDAVAREINDTRAAVQAEATARAAAETLRQKDEREQKDRVIQNQRQTQWQWFALVAVPIVGWIINNVLPSGGLP